MIRIYPVGDVLGIEGKLKNVTASFKKCDVFFFFFFKSNIVLITIMIINKESNEIYYSIVLIKYI